MLIGRPPFRAETPSATLMAHIHQSVSLPKDYGPDLGPQLEPIILRALAKEPDDRYESPSQMVAALAGLGAKAEPETDFEAARTILQTPAPTPGSAVETEMGARQGHGEVAGEGLPAPRKEVRLSDYCLIQGTDAPAPPFSLTPNPPKDTDGRREDSGRGWVRELQGRWPGVLG